MILNIRPHAIMIAWMMIPMLHGFVLVPRSDKVIARRALQESNGHYHEENDMQEYEDARKAFEQEMVSLPTVQSQEEEEEPAVLLTASTERIKEMELNMLEYLQDSDAVIDPLVDLWTRERPNAAEDLISMERYCSPGLVKEAAALRRIIDEYDAWVEPKSRLAVLLFTKGLYEEAEYWCQEVLRAKPWHFEVGQLLVVLYLRMGYYEQAILVARQYSLPALNERTDHRRRRAWVEAAMGAAREELQEARKAANLAVSSDPMEQCPVEAGGANTSRCWQ
jgi:tetratricopeptide (TPR) repeat protein